jgi:tol-pal system protein YbgF
MTSLKRVIAMAMLSCIAMGAFAEDAPVYDIDNFPPQFDGSSETSSLMQGATKDQAQAEKAYAPTNMSLNQRVARLEQQINNALHSDVTDKVNDMQSQLQTLRGQVEELTHQLQQLQSQQKSMYSDLDKRLNHKPANTTVAAATPDTNEPVADSAVMNDDPPAPDENPAPKSHAKAKPVSATPQDTTSSDDAAADTSTKPEPAAKKSSSSQAKGNQPNVAEEQQIYQTAYNLIKAKKYNEAASTLQSMLKKYPSGQFAANAHYWLGELYGLMGKNEQATAEFGSVVRDYPESPKIADAQLKLGLIYSSQLKWPEAKSAFKKVINHYPGTSWARLASEQLKQLKQAGH